MSCDFSLDHYRELLGAAKAGGYRFALVSGDSFNEPSTKVAAGLVEACDLADRDAVAALVDRIGLRHPLHQAAPVKILRVDVDADILQQVGPDIPQRLQHRKVGGHQQHRALVLVA